jgi:predicted small metal-binding protein
VVGVIVHGRRGDMANVLRCGDLMVGCPHVVHGATADEVFRQAAKHAADVHHIKELTPGLAAKVKSNIRTEES